MTNYTAAEANYQTFTRSYPTNAAAWASLGYFHERMTNYTSAIADFTQCIQLDPTSSLYYSIRARMKEESAKALGKLGDQKQQLAALDQSLKDRQQAATMNPEALCGLGRFECRQGRCEQGIADLTLWLQTCPTNYAGLTSRAYAYEIVGNRQGTNGNVKGQQEMLAKALADWNQLVALKSKSQITFLGFRGEFYARNHQYASALSDFHQAIELNTNDNDSLSIPAWFLATCPDPAYRDGTNAVAIAQKACASDSYWHGYNVGSLAAAYAEIGDFAQAVKYQKQALKELEKDVDFNDAFRSEMHHRLTLYEQGQPCHQPLGLDVYFE